MPAHDWSNVDDYLFHDVHQAWVTHLKERLNKEILPTTYYALAELRTGAIAPDVVALQFTPSLPDTDSGNGGVAVMPPPKATITAHSRNLSYVKRQDTLVIRHASDRKIVALLEIASRGNKASRDELDYFVRKAQSAFQRNIHFLFVDLHPPGRLDPRGLHGAIWETRGEDPPAATPGKTLVAASYEASDDVNAFVEPFAVGERIPNMPLFLREDFYVVTPFEETYLETLAGLPEHDRERIER